MEHMTHYSMYCRLAPYLVSALVLVLSIGLLVRGHSGFAVAALIVAGASFFSVRRLITVFLQQQRSVDQQLLQSQKLASLGELSSGIAHEINNPLAIIGQEAEWLRHLLENMRTRDAQWQSEVKDSLREIIHQVDRGREITHKILDFARHNEPLLQLADSNKLLEDMVKLVEKEAGHKGIAVLRRYAADLPAISTDPPLVRQVMLNLLNNAVYAIGNNGFIEVATDQVNDSFVVFKVSDTGCGIPEQNLSRIFDPFFTTKPQGQGTGLGLSICHGIVTKLGGRISVESRVGEGTTFGVQLPLKPVKGVE
jgi:two-component system, NtrC family, sensor kinase